MKDQCFWGRYFPEREEKLIQTTWSSCSLGQGTLRLKCFFCCEVKIRLFLLNHSIPLNMVSFFSTFLKATKFPAWGRCNFSLCNGITWITEVMLNRKYISINILHVSEEASVSRGPDGSCSDSTSPPFLLLQTLWLNIKIESLSIKSFSQWFLSSYAEAITLMRDQVFTLFIFILSNMTDGCTQRRQSCKRGTRYCSSISWFNSPGRIWKSVMTAFTVWHWDIIRFELQPSELWLLPQERTDLWSENIRKNLSLKLKFGCSNIFVAAHS